MGEYAELALESALFSGCDLFDSYDDLTEDKMYLGYDEDYWTTKNGVTIKIEDMELSHVKNTVRMLKRKGFRVPAKMNRRVYKGE
jgi:hypothetical protein